MILVVPLRLDAVVASATINDVSHAVTHEYGAHPEQVADLIVPGGDGPHPVAVLIHGGFWRERWRRNLMEPLAAALASAGWATWNLEYRRVNCGGGVPETLDDVMAAYDRLSRIEESLDLEHIVAIGHSAGGHLALWLASARPLRLAVSLAGVNCLTMAAGLGIGSGAVADFCGGLPAQRQDVYALADPAAHLPLRVPQLVVHGDRDDTVPMSLSVEWTTRSRAHGDRCDILLLDGVDHDAVIDPSSPAWAEVARRLPSRDR